MTRVSVTLELVREAMASWERAVQLNPADAELSETMDSLRERLENEKSAVP